MYMFKIITDNNSNIGAICHRLSFWFRHVSFVVVYIQARCCGGCLQVNPGRSLNPLSTHRTLL